MEFCGWLWGPAMKQSAEKYLQYLSSVKNSSPHTILNYGKDLSQFLEFLSPDTEEAGRRYTGLLKKLINILNRLIKPRMKKPERMRRVRNYDYVRGDAERLELGGHFFTLLKWTIGAAVYEEYWSTLWVHMSDR